MIKREITPLKVDQLKMDLSKLYLLTTKSKTELQMRLIEELRKRNINIETYGFEERGKTEEILDIYAYYGFISRRAN